MKAYDLFCLAHNYDNAANILIKNLAVAYENHARNKEMLLKKAYQLKDEIRTITTCDVTPTTASSLDVLLQLIEVMMLVDQSKEK